MKTQIGLLFVGFDKKTKDSLGYLFTYLNKIQKNFEYIIGSDPSTDFGNHKIIQALNANKVVSQVTIDDNLDSFYKVYIENRGKTFYDYTTQPTYQNLILICENKLDTGYYSRDTLNNPISLIACGSFDQVFHSMNKIQPIVALALLLSIDFLAFDKTKVTYMKYHIETKVVFLILTQSQTALNSRS